MISGRRRGKKPRGREGKIKLVFTHLEARMQPKYDLPLISLLTEFPATCGNENSVNVPIHCFSVQPPKAHIELWKTDGTEATAW